MPREAHQIIANRYQLQDKLGTGAMGAVHRANDRLTGNVIALKQIALETQDLHFASRGADDSAETLRLALATEFKILASLRHPHIISVIDYGFDQQRQPYFTMDYLPGAQSILEASADKSIEEQVDLLIQTLSALAYLHRRGILHRDIKPGNVLVADARVRVLDFGLSIEADAAQKRAGTLIYMAPEMLRTSQASEASDLYAVGVLAYEIWAGQHPFDKSSQQLVMDILERDPDVSMLPELMQPIIARLLAKAPADRFSSADQVIQALSEAIGQPAPEESFAVRESFLQAATFVGRETELGQLTDALENAINGQGSSWLVGGESGAGKSRLLDEMRTQALVSGVQVVRGQAVEGGGQPYQLWRNALRRAALSTEFNDLTAGVIKLLVPDINVLLEREIPDPPELAGQAAQQRLVLTIAEVFRQTAQSGQPLVLILEDLQWSIESLEPLKALNRLVAQAPILVIASYRSEEIPDLPNQLSGMSTLPLPRLAEEYIAELSASMLGESGKQPHVLDLLQKETEGNTFFLVETVRALAEEAGGLDAIGRMTLPEEVFAGGVRRLLQRRLARVPEEHHHLLKLAAIIGRALDLKLINVFTEEDSDGDSWLDACANLAVLDVQEGGWQFAHDKLRAELLAGLTEAERPNLHLQAAEAYESVYPDNPSYAATQTEHWQAAGDREKTRHYAHIAGNYAAEQYVNDEAVRFFSLSLTLAPENDTLERYALYLDREKVYDILGDRAAQALDLDQLTLLANAPDQKTVVALRYGEYYNNVGEYASAITISEQVVESSDSSGQAQALNNSGRAYMQQGDYQPASEQYQRAYRLAEEIEDHVQTAQAWNGLGEVAFRQGDYLTATNHHQETLHLWQTMGNMQGQAQSFRYLGQIAHAQGKYEKAREYYFSALQLAQQMGDQPAEARLLLNMGTSDWRQGAYQRAGTYLQQSLALARTTGDRRTAASSLKDLGIVASYQGQYDKAIDYYQQSMTIFQDIGDRAGVSAILNNLGIIAIDQGRYDDAIIHYQECLSIRQEIGDRAGIGTTFTNMGVVAERQGKYDLALDYWEQSLAIKQDVGDQAGAGKVLNNLGVVAERHGQYDKAQFYYQKSLAIREDIGDREGEGHMLNNLGVVTGRQGQHVKELAFLMESLDIRQEIGDRAGVSETLSNLGNMAYAQRQYDKALDFYQQSLAISRDIGNREREGETLKNLGALTFAQLDYLQTEKHYQQALDIHQSLGSLPYMVEDWAGLALVALKQQKQKTAKAYADQLLAAWADNPAFNGAEAPLHTLHITWQVCQALGLPQTDEVLAAAADVINTYLENHPDPETQAAYLKQPHHQALWQAWQAREAADAP